MFDFDELDALEERLAAEAVSKAVAGTGEADRRPSGGSTATCGPLSPGSELDVDGEDGEVDECLSEVWPDDVPNDLEALYLGADGQDGFEEWDNVAPRPWEVIFSRVVIRERPALDARVVGICSHSELVFEDHDCENPQWVRLVDGLGFILKDGRLKDEKLGMLLKPFAWPPEVHVPKELRGRVWGALKDGWVRLHAEHTLLGPGEIRKLRKAGEDAAIAACKGGKFDFHTYDDHLWGEVMSLVAAAGARHHVPPTPQASPNAAGGGGFGGGGFGGMSLISTSGAPAPFGHPPPPRPAGGGAGGFPWSHDAATLHSAGSRVTADYAKRLVESMRCRRLPCEQDALEILAQAEQLWLQSPSLVRLQVPAGATLRVIGDVHGQYWDLLHILETFGSPSPTNWFLFNGDLVDRGQFSTEVVLAVFAWKVALPECVHVNRGNHEALNLNSLFGFSAEAKLKYNDNVFSLFSRAFRALPLATVVNDSVFVVHGGLSDKQPVLLDEVEQLDRVLEPQEGSLLMSELLWSDPMECFGSRPSPRGGGVLFGPDITQRFCDDNALLCVIRSHEMRPEGFEWTHGGLCLTLFSAANYCGICGNRGAVCSIRPREGIRRLSREDLDCDSFEAHEPPHEAGMPHGFGIFA